MGVVEQHGGTGAVDDRVDLLVDDPREELPHRQRRRTDRRLELAVRGDHVGGVAGVDRSEDHLDRIAILNPAVIESRCDPGRKLRDDS